MTLSYAGLFLNALIPISIGGIPISGEELGSAKSRLLHLMGIRFDNITSFITYFIFIILIKSVLIVTEKMLYYYIRNRALLVSQKEILKVLIPFGQAMPETDPTRKAKDLRSFILKVLYRIPPDILYLITLITGLALVSIKYAGITTMTFLFGILLSALTNKYIKRKEESSHRSTAFKRILKLLPTIGLFDQQLSANNILNKEAGINLRNERTKIIRSSVLTGLLTLLFFANMLMIISIELQNPLGFNSVNMLTFTLLLLYIQSTYKRIGRNSLIYYDHKEFFLSVINNRIDNANPISKNNEINNVYQWIINQNDKIFIADYSVELKTERTVRHLELHRLMTSRGNLFAVVDPGLQPVGSTILEAMSHNKHKKEKENIIKLTAHFFSVDTESANYIIYKSIKEWNSKKNALNTYRFAAIRACLSAPDYIWFEKDNKEINPNELLDLYQKIESSPLHRAKKLIVYDHNQ